MEKDLDDPSGQGSWLPLIIIVTLLLVRWLTYGQGKIPVRTRRWYSQKRLQLKRKFGYRDESKYKMGAGDGASQRHKRQG